MSYILLLRPRETGIKIYQIELDIWKKPLSELLEDPSSFPDDSICELFHDIARTGNGTTRSRVEDFTFHLDILFKDKDITFEGEYRVYSAIPLSLFKEATEVVII